MLVFIEVGIEKDRRQRIRRDWAVSLAEHMQAGGVSRKELRRRLERHGVEVTEQAIGCWIRAETSPRVEHQAAIAAALRVPVRRLFPIELAEAV